MTKSLCIKHTRLAMSNQAYVIIIIIIILIIIITAIIATFMSVWSLCVLYIFIFFWSVRRSSSSRISPKQDNIQADWNSVQSHAIYVCAWAVSALILLPVVNLSLKMDRFPVWRETFLRSTLLFVYFGDFSLHMCSFVYTTSLLPVKIWRHYLNSAHPISYKHADISGVQHHIWRFLWR